jgi:hypothetical protein
MRGQWFVDDTGTLMPVSSVERDPFLTNEQFLDFFIIQMGSVHISTNNQTIITFDKHSVSLAALLGTVDWIFETSLQRATFRHPGENAVLLKLSKAACIEHLTTLAGQIASSSRFTTSTTPLTISPFSSRYMAAKEICAEVCEQRRDQLLHLLFQGLFLLTETEPISGAPIVVTMGAGHRRFDSEFVDTSKGRALCDIHDKEFGVWLAKEYGSVRDSGEARADDVSALVDWRSHGKYRHRYSRLLMPVHQNSGRQLLLTATHLN